MFESGRITMKSLRPVLLIVVTVLGCASSAYSKGSPDKIIITGGGLLNQKECPIEITDSKVLKGFDPWRGQFIDWPAGDVAAPADQSRSYEVFFYMKWDGRRSNFDRGKLKMIYTVRYVPARDGAPGYIYLPGRGEEFHDNNSGTIWRKDDDGKWHRASAAWDAVMKRLITSNSVTRVSFLPQVFGWLSRRRRNVGGI
jgi:hypothetical protein